MNRIKELLKQKPEKKESQPVYVVFNDDVQFEDKTNEILPSRFNDKIKEQLRKKQALYSKPKSRIQLIDSDDEKEIEQKEKEKKAEAIVYGEKEREEETETRESSRTSKPRKFGPKKFTSRSTSKIKEGAEEEEEEEYREEIERVEGDEGNEEIDFNNVSKIVEYIREERDTRIPSVENAYYLNNRKIFTAFVTRMFGKYREELASMTKPASCDTVSSTKKLSLLIHQKLITDYLNMYTPYRGLLLFHGLGSGKTCSSIAIAENFKNANKHIIVMTPASLKPNFIKEIKKCGDIIYRLNNNWVWKSYNELYGKIDLLEKELNLSKGYIKRHDGAWIISRETQVASRKNKGKQTDRNRTVRANHTLEEQLNEMIQHKYHHISYNGIRNTHIKQLTEDYTVNPFDDKVVIIDEAHKFISPIVNKIRSGASRRKKETEQGVALRLYEYLMSAKNARIILLTGTPIMNYPNEISVLFNILRGYIHTYELRVRVETSQPVSDRTLPAMLSGSPIYKQIDYLKYSPSDGTIIVTRNPLRFLSQITKNGSYAGVRINGEEDPTGLLDISDSDFIREVTQELAKLNIVVETVEEKNYKNLPDSFDDFMARFYSGEEMINKYQLSNRILGLTSYFSGTPELLPRYKKEENYHVIQVAMSQYQTEQYAIQRNREIVTEKNKRIKEGTNKGNSKEDFAEPSSSYRMFSRMFCNFTMPTEIGRSMPSAFSVEDKDAAKTKTRKTKKEETVVGGRGYSDEDDDTDDELEFWEGEGGEDSDDELYGTTVFKTKKTTTKKTSTTTKPKKKPAVKFNIDDEFDDEPVEKKEEAKPSNKTRVIIDDEDYEETPKAESKAEPQKEPEPKVTQRKTKNPIKKKVTMVEDIKEEEKPKYEEIIPIDAPQPEKEPEREIITEKEKEPMVEPVAEPITEPVTAVNPNELEFADPEENDPDEVLEQDLGYKHSIEQEFSQLDAAGDRYLSEEGLNKYSPKFLNILQNIKNPAHEGLHLVYSQFRSMEGIGIFSLVLKHNGFAEFKIKRGRGGWMLDIAEEDMGNPSMFFTLERNPEK